MSHRRAKQIRQYLSSQGKDWRSNKRAYRKMKEAFAKVPTNVKATFN